MKADEFEQLSPQQLGDLLIIHDERIRREDRRHALLTTMYANFHRARGEEMWHIADFFPSLNIYRPAPATDEEISSKLDALAERA